MRLKFTFGPDGSLRRESLDDKDDYQRDREDKGKGRVNASHGTSIGTDESHDPSTESTPTMSDTTSDTTETSSSRPSIGKFNKNQLYVPFPLHPDLRKRMLDEFKIHVQGNDYGNEHEHPMLYVERIKLEREMYSMAEGPILDVGGNPVRHKKEGREDVWSCCPPLTPNDHGRVQRFQDAKATNYCLHTVQECDCIEPTTVMFLHSHYYVSKEDTLSLLYNTGAKKILTAVHDFDKVVGTFYENEAYYRVDEQGRHYMNVKGSNIGYQGSACHWLRGNYFGYRGRAMQWHRVCKIGTSVIYSIHPTPVTDNRDFAVDGVLAQLSDLTYYGAMSANHLETNFGVFNMPQYNMYSFGKHVALIQKNSSPILVPKELIHHAQDLAVAMPRTKDGFATVQRRLRPFMMKLDIPQSQAADVLMYAAAFGFCKSVMNEVSIMYGLIKPMLRQFEVLNDALNFKFHLSIPRIVVIIFAVSLAATTIAIGSYFTFWPLYILGGFIFLVPTSFLTISIFKQVGNTSRLNTIRSWMTADHRSVACAEEIEPLLSDHMPGYDSKKDLMPLGEGKNCQFVGIFSEDKMRITGPRPYGLTIGNSTPLVSSDTPHNTLIAISNRVTKPTPPVNDLVWTQLLTYVEKFFHDLFPDFGPIDPSPYDQWNRRFPKNRQTEHDAAKSEYDSFGLPADLRVVTRRSAFLKREKLLKSTTDNVKDYNPRLINGVTCMANVVLGPWVYSFSKRLAQVWNPQHYLCYAAGLTTNEIGSWYDEAKEQYMFSDEVRALVNDYTEFDATQGYYCWRLEEMIYLKCGLVGDAYKIFAGQADTHGYAKFGYKFSYPFGRKSGDPNTSCGNTLINGLVMHFAIVSYYAQRLGLSVLDINPSTPEIRMIVMGDDNLTLCHRNLELNELAGHVEATLKNLGFVPKLQATLRDTEVEFCSNLFWPSSKGTLPAPKPGRLLARLGWAVKPEPNGLSWFRGVCLGLRDTVNHVPIAGDFVRKGIQLTSKVKAKKNPDDEHRFRASEAAETSTETLAFMMRRYGINEGDIENFRSILRQVKQLPVSIRSDMVEDMVKIDM